MNPLADVAAVLSGSTVGFSLGLVGGGGSILAVPLLLYVVGVGEPHLAIGTSAVAVSANAFANLANHGRRGNVAWHCAAVIAVGGIFGAALGSEGGKYVEGQELLLLFAIVMIVVGVAMLRRKDSTGAVPKRLTPIIVARLAGAGFAIGAVAGFFGIGGGFLIVPGLVFAAGLPMLKATASSLLAVGTCALTTAVSYALSGLVDWPVAAEFIAGGIVGGMLGIWAATRLAHHKRALTRLFAGIIFAMAAYMMYRSAVLLAS
ncbi:MAG: sulfite exporter TauE/SafE family protein [Alphaproteobacteria bacterium]|nr:sulfite exporter TauE/SafE family protein [Alphaproteobacteria bacterium]